MKEDKLTLAVVNLQEDMREVKEILKRHEEKLDLFDEVLKGQDKMMQILLRIDQERLATNARMDRFETIQKQHTNEIQELKTATGIV